MRFGKLIMTGVVGAAAGAALQKKANDKCSEEKREGNDNLYKEFTEKHNRLAEKLRAQKKDKMKA